MFQTKHTHLDLFNPKAFEVVIRPEEKQGTHAADRVFLPGARAGSHHHRQVCQGHRTCSALSSDPHHPGMAVAALASTGGATEAQTVSDSPPQAPGQQVEAGGRKPG